MSEITLSPPRPKNHGWIYFFVFVFLASVFVALFMIWYNRSIQLTPEQLDAAKKLWQESNITNYNMIYKKRLLNDQDWTTFTVKVRDQTLPIVGASTVGLMGSTLGEGSLLAASALSPGRAPNPKVQEVLMNGRPLEAEGDHDPLPYHSMDAQFRYLERFLDLDQKPNAPKVYFVADFDQRNGAIIRYTRYDASQKQRVEMLFNLQILMR